MLKYPSIVLYWFATLPLERNVMAMAPRPIKPPLRWLVLLDKQNSCDNNKIMLEILSLRFESSNSFTKAVTSSAA